MRENLYTDSGRKKAMRRRLQRSPAFICRFSLTLTSVLLLAGCATLPDWVPDWTGGEGKTAQPVSARIIDGTPEAKVPNPWGTGHSREEVLEIQTDLAALGYYSDGVDGFMGPLTSQAIKAYQKDAGLTVDGVITPELADSLRIATRSKSPTVPAADPVENPPEAVVVVAHAEIQPYYDAGDVYIWSNGRVETVVGVAGNKLFWQVDNGVRFTADRNFLIPPSIWTGPAGNGEADARVDMRKSWPVKAESPLFFEVSENGVVEEWRCENTGTEHVSVPAGQFDVVALACDRDSAPPGEWVRRVWLYAPAVRHYVARSDIMADGRRITKTLVGIRPGAKNWPPAVRAGLSRAIHDALDGLAAGEKSVWGSTVIKDEFEIVPGAVRDTEGGGQCRVFNLIASSAGNSRSYPALACTPNSGGEWRIPGDSDGGVDGVSLLTDTG